MFRAITRSVTVTATILMLSATTGCSLKHQVKIDQTQFDEAMAKIDRMILGIDKGLTGIRQESEAWRKTFAELEQQLHEDAKDVLANEVKETSLAFAQAIETSAKGSVDYIEARIKDNLKAFRVALEHAREKVKDAKGKNKPEAIKEAFDELANVVVVPQPVVTAFILPQVEVKWNAFNPSEGYTIRNPNGIIAVNGWGFERPAADANRFAAFIVARDEKGNVIKERRLPESALYKSTRFLIQLKLTDPGLNFTLEDNALVFRIGTSPEDQRFLPIVHARPEDPKVEAARRQAADDQKRKEEEEARAKREKEARERHLKAVVEDLTVIIDTGNDDKDREIFYTYTLWRPAPHGDVYQRRDVGNGELWPDDDNGKRAKDHREFRIPLMSNKEKIPLSELKNCDFKIQYDASGDPRHRFEVRVIAQLSDNTSVTLVPTTAVEMGHHDKGKIKDHKDRIFELRSFNYETAK